QVETGTATNEAIINEETKRNETANAATEQAALTNNQQGRKPVIVSNWSASPLHRAVSFAIDKLSSTIPPQDLETFTREMHSLSLRENGNRIIWWRLAHASQQYKLFGLSPPHPSFK
ncbi:hypothetical protein PFISCL1PPCAC_28123, partial [Pristionchus fissidentatus]